MLILLLLAAGLSFGQAVKPDTWERTKECAARADKLMERDLVAGPHDSSASMWRNHYSAKFGKCLLWIIYAAKAKTREKDDPFGWNMLIDAFERGGLAQSAWGPLAQTACINDEEYTSQGCEEQRSLYACMIEGKRTTCQKAAEFISEAMRD